MNTLVPLCGYDHGWCVKQPNCSCWKMPAKCRYFRRNHPAFPTISMEKTSGNLRVMESMRYDTIYATRFDYDEVEHGVIKTDQAGTCDTCKMETTFWDVNVKVYVCSNRCRSALYRKMEEAIK